MTFSHKDWKNDPDPSTPLSAEAIEDLEDRVTAPVAIIGETVDCDTSGATDQASVIQAAIDDVASRGGGNVLLPATDYSSGSIKIGSLIDVPQAVNLRGHGQRETRLLCSAAGAGVRFNAYGGATNSRGGRCGDFHIDGNNTATNPMKVDHAVNRSFTDFRVSRPGANGIALLVETSQNCNFDRFDLEGTEATTGATGLKVTESAGSCRFGKYSILGFSYAGIWVTQTTSGAQEGVGYPEPRYISFDDGIVEHGNPATTCAVRIHSGRDLWFTRQALFVATDQASSGPYTIVEINDAGAGVTQQVHFDKGSAQGGTAPSKNSTAFDIQAGASSYRTRITNWTFGNNTYGVVAASGQTAEVDAYRATSTDTMFSGAGTITSRAVTVAWGGSSGSSIWYDAVVDGAAVGDGTTDDTTALEDAAVAAVAAGKYLWIPEPSSYYKITSQLDWRINNLVVRGSGMNTCIIKQATSNTGIVLVGGTGGDGYQDIGHLQLTYVSSPTSGHTNSIGLSIDHAVMCNYHDLRILNTATGVQLVDSASSGTTTAFSNCFTNINVYGYRIAGMYMAAANTNSTGNSYRNIYIKNDWVGAHDTATSRALFLQNTDEDEFEQLNVEWMTLASGIPAIHLSQARATFKGLHLEEVITPGGASEQAIVRIYDNSDLTLVSGDGEFVTFSSGAGVQSVFHLGASSHLVCDTFKLGNVTADADTVAVVDYEDATCKAEIRQLSGSGWDTLTNDDVAATPNTRRIGDTYFPPLNAQSGTTYTLALTDANGAVQCTNGSAITVTVPPNSSVAFPIGTEIEVAQMGAGTVTLAAGSGVTINSRGGLLALNGQYAVSSLRKTATDSWLLTGDLA